MNQELNEKIFNKIKSLFKSGDKGVPEVDEEGDNLEQFIHEIYSNIHHNLTDLKNYLSEPTSNNKINKLNIVQDINDNIKSLIIDYINRGGDRQNIQHIEKIIRQELNKIDNDTTLVNVEKILVSITKKLIDTLENKYNTSDSIENEDDYYKDYRSFLKAFQYYPTKNYEALKKIVKSNIANPYKLSKEGNNLKEQIKKEFDTKWESYRNDWINDEDTIREAFKYFSLEMPNYFKDYNTFLDRWKASPFKNEFSDLQKKYSELFEKNEKNTHFLNYYNKRINYMFENIWDEYIVNRWKQDYKKEIEDQRLPVSHLKELKTKLDSINV